MSGCIKRNRLPDLRETYSSGDTRPFGANVAFRILQNCFPVDYIHISKLPFQENALISDDTSSLYVCITKNFFSNEEEVDAILDYVYKGNTFVLASSVIDTLLMKKIYCKVQDPGRITSFIPPFFRRTAVTLLEEARSSKDTFGYYYRPFSSFFSELNDNYSRVIGYNGEGQTNCMVFFWGRGKMFLHTDPRAFSNYFLLTDNNYRYMQQLLQLMSSAPQHVYWNDYYCRQLYRDTKKNFSTIDEILKYPALANAFCLSLGLLLVYLLFESKRRQRVINKITRNENSSVAFTETIARLYLQKNNNKNMAEKMHAYFNEYIRTSYYLTSQEGSDDFINELSKKSGMPLEKTIALYNAINHANESSSVDNYQLLSLNNQIQEFYKIKK